MELVKLLHIHSVGNYVVYRCNEQAQAQAERVQQILSHHQFGDNSQFEPRVNQTVAVYSAPDKKWLRAQVLSVNRNRRDCLIQYTRLGCTVTVTFLAVHPVPAEIDLERIPAQSMQITLASIYPAELNFNGDLAPSVRWTPEPSTVIRENYLDSATSYMYQNEVTIHGFHFGHLYLCTATDIVNLADNLVEKGRAIRSDNWLAQVKSLKLEVLNLMTGGFLMFSKEVAIMEKHQRQLRRRSRLAVSGQRSRSSGPLERNPTSSLNVERNTSDFEHRPSSSNARSLERTNSTFEHIPGPANNVYTERTSAKLNVNNVKDGLNANGSVNSTANVDQNNANDRYSTGRQSRSDAYHNNRPKGNVGHSYRHESRNFVNNSNRQSANNEYFNNRQSTNEESYAYHNNRPNRGQNRERWYYQNEQLSRGNGEIYGQSNRPSRNYRTRSDFSDEHNENRERTNNCDGRYNGSGRNGNRNTIEVKSDGSPGHSNGHDRNQANRQNIHHQTRRSKSLHRPETGELEADATFQLETSFMKESQKKPSSKGLLSQLLGSKCQLENRSNDSNGSQPSAMDKSTNNKASAILTGQPLTVTTSQPSVVDRILSTTAQFKPIVGSQHGQNNPANTTSVSWMGKSSSENDRQSRKPQGKWNINSAGIAKSHNIESQQFVPPQVEYLNMKITPDGSKSLENVQSPKSPSHTESTTDQTMANPPKDTSPRSSISSTDTTLSPRSSQENTPCPSDRTKPNRLTRLSDLIERANRIKLSSPTSPPNSSCVSIHSNVRSLDSNAQTLDSKACTMDSNAHSLDSNAPILRDVSNTAQSTNLWNPFHCGLDKISQSTSDVSTLPQPPQSSDVLPTMYQSQSNNDLRRDTTPKSQSSDVAPVKSQSSDVAHAKSQSSDVAHAKSQSSDVALKEPVNDVALKSCLSRSKSVTRRDSSPVNILTSTAEPTQESQQLELPPSPTEVPSMSPKTPSSPAIKDRTPTFEPYLKLYKPVVHTRDPLDSDDGTVAPGDIETRLHHYIKENYSFPFVSVAQVASVAAILEHRDTCVIHSLKSQYNSAYLGSLLSVLVEKKHFYNQKKSFEIEPLVLILAPNSKICDELYSVTSRFLSKLCDLNVKTIYGSSPENEKKALFSAVNGCDILITTPRCLDRLKETRIVGLDSVYHYVLERADILFDKFYKEVTQILRCLQFISKTRIEKFTTSASTSSTHIQCPELQIVLSSEVYNKKLENFIRNNLVKPVLIFSNFLEAAIYGQVDFNLSIITLEDKKLAYLLETLQKYEDSNHKVAVLCDTSKEVQRVSEFLTTVYPNVPNLFTIDGRVNHIVIHSYMSRWMGKHKELPILIIDDEAMCNVFAEDVTVLIHYSLPNKKKAFPRRFKLMKEALVNMFDDHNDVQLPTSHCHLFLDKNNDLQLHDILSLSQRLHLAIPPEIIELGKQMKIRREGEKHNTPVCAQLLMFGRCELGPTCTYRHVLVPSLDAPLEHLPSQGLIKFNVLSVLDATHFTIRILETFSNSEWHPHRDKATYLKLSMKRHYSKQESRIAHYNPALGDIVAVERGSMFIRARVVELLGGVDSGDATSVRVRLCDSPGKIMEYPVSKIYTVPSDLKAYPDQIVTAFATRVQPIDEDIQWNAGTGLFMQSLVDEHTRGEHDKYFVGKIVLALNNTLFLDPFRCAEYLPKSKTEISHFIVRDSLLNAGRAVPHPTHVELLYELCEHIEGSIPEYVKDDLPLATLIELPSPQWAHLNQEDLNICTLVGIVTPGQFFLRLVNSEDTLAKLNKEIVKDVNRTSSRYEKDNCPAGLLCLARSDDKSGYNRAQVANSDDEHLAMVLFVDYSDRQEISYDDLVPIHRPQVISKLPFQMIECSLAGVEPSVHDNGQWSKEAYDFLDDYSRLFARVVSVNAQGVETGGCHYAVELFDLGSRVNLNKELVVLQHAKYTEDGPVCLTQDDEAIFQQIEKMMESDEEEEEWGELEEKTQPSCDVQEKRETVQNDDMFDAKALQAEDLLAFFNELDPDFVTGQKKMIQDAFESSRSISGAPDPTPATDSTSATDPNTTSSPVPSLESKSSKQRSSRSKSTPKSPFTLGHYGGIVHDTEAQLTPLPDNLEIDPDMPPLTIASYPARTVWYQTHGFVHVHFHLPALHENFTCDVHGKFVHFHVEINDRLYENQLPLMCYVVPEESLCEWNGFELRLKLKKQAASLSWPCLLEDGVDREIRWLHYHVDHLCDNEEVNSSDDDDDFLPGPPISGVKGIKGKFTLSDDEMSSDSEDNAACKVPEDM